MVAPGDEPLTPLDPGGQVEMIELLMENSDQWEKPL